MQYNTQNNIYEQSVSIPVTYNHVWQDGFGARGWKLSNSIDDPAVIAATAETGDRINTSVLIHDIMDHFLCGLPLSGHRNEAAALYQLAIRTGSDISSDFAQMVDEDLLRGHVNGESLRDFLPDWLITLVPNHINDGVEMIEFLLSRLGKLSLRQTLIMRFIEIGAGNASVAKEVFERTGLDYSMRKQYGVCLQHILNNADRWVLNHELGSVEGRFFLDNERCELEIAKPVEVQFHAACIKQ